MQTRTLLLLLVVVLGQGCASEESTRRESRPEGRADGRAYGRAAGRGEKRVEDRRCRPQPADDDLDAKLAELRRRIDAARRARDTERQRERR